MNNIELNEISVELLKSILSKSIKPNEIYSIDKIKAIICGYLKIDFEDIDDNKLKTAGYEYFISLNDNNLLYQTIVKLSSESTNWYFINKIAREKSTITKKDVIKNLRCLPLEKRIACLNNLDIIFKDNYSITINEPQDLYILDDTKTFKKDSKYKAHENLESFAVQNKNVAYSKQTKKKSEKRKLVNIGVGIVCTGFVSILYIASALNLNANDINNQIL